MLENLMFETKAQFFYVVYFIRQVVYVRTCNAVHGGKIGSEKRNPPLLVKYNVKSNLPFPFILSQYPANYETYPFLKNDVIDN